MASSRSPARVLSPLQASRWLSVSRGGSTTVSTSVAGLLTAVLVSVAAVPTAAAARPATAPDGADRGRASATVLRTDLDIGLLDKAVQVPLNLTLNEVTAPGGGRERAEQTALTAELDGVHQGRPFSVLRSDVARTTATVDKGAAHSKVELVKARVHLPGLPTRSLVEVEAVNASARCAVGEQPVAEANPLGTVTVLGQQAKLTAGGPTKVTLPGVGDVTLELARTESTSRTAAASALRLSVSLNPLNLGVAEVEGRVTLAEATCRTPRKAGEVTTEEEPATGEKSDQGVRPQTEPAQGEETQADPADSASSSDQASPDLAETGANARTPYLLGAGLALFALGGALLLTRRRRT